ncbi:hypothetical protein Hdeb2414_s0006g00212971 [Helianthus debilis subsp. tardiflorus]
MFGLATFILPETVKAILAKGNPHFLSDSWVIVKPYRKRGRGKDTDKGHNVPCSIDAASTTGTVVENMATFLRESRIAKALSDKTVVYESHVRAFWNTARYDATDKTIHAVVKKKDENKKDIDVEVVFGVEDVRRILDLQDSDDDPTIISERLAKGLWCRIGFTSHINGKMYKRSF